MPAETLSEIIAEGKRLEAAFDAVCIGESPAMTAVIDAAQAMGGFYAEHGTRLLALAEAAVECERNLWGGGFTALQRALATVAPQSDGSWESEVDEAAFHGPDPAPQPKGDDDAR